MIEWDDVDWAIDRVTVGMEKPNKDALVGDLELVAFHEAGHAIVGGLMPEYDTVTKISITPRTSGAGGLTFFSPLEDRVDNVVTWHYLESQIAVAWGGRVAEELVFGPDKVTTGASGDLQQIFRVARAMVCQLGMSRLPPLTYDFESQGDGDVDWQLSRWLKERINSEICRIASNGYYTAKEILLKNEDLLWALARRLIQDDQVTEHDDMALKDIFGTSDSKISTNFLHNYFHILVGVPRGISFHVIRIWCRNLSVQIVR